MGSITHTTSADSSFTAQGKTEWERAHTFSLAQADIAGLTSTDSPPLAGVSLTPVTWATINALTPTDGLIQFASNIGTNAVPLIANGTRWRAFGGTAKVRQLGAEITGIANTEQIILQWGPVPAAFLQTNDIIRFWFEPTKSGGTDSLLWYFRAGTAGTTSDTAVINGVTLLGASGVSGGFPMDFKVTAQTTLRKVGGATNQSSAAGGGTSAGADVTISDLSANAMYFSLGVRSSGATNTVGCRYAYAEIHTP